MTPQVAEAFFARDVIFVEGESDQLVVRAIASKVGRDLDAEGVAVVALNGVRSIERFAKLFGPNGFDHHIRGLYDINERTEIEAGLEAAGWEEGQSAEQMGFFACQRDLEDELIRAVGVLRTKETIGELGDADRYRKFALQPSQRDRAELDVLHDFIAKQKVDYATALSEAMTVEQIPQVLLDVIGY